MSGSVESAPLAIAIESAARPSRLASWWDKTERALEWASDYLNPILVKEARQSLKSGLFGITFGLLLLLAWGGSVFAMAAWPDAAYNAYGSWMFMMYYAFLSFFLLVIVPFGAFRSLAVEQEEKCYEVLCTTALRPWQLVSGKLGGAALQMIVYLSAVAPCIAFTYLLRGIDFPTILFFLFWLVATSLAFSMIALFLGTLSEHKFLQVLMAVVTIVGVIIGFIINFWIVAAALQEVILGEVEFWTVNAGFFTVFATYFALAFFAAVARVTFSSDNRSTKLRIVMLVQQVMLIGWVGYLCVAFPDASPEVGYAILIPSGIHWAVMGALMTGESPDLSFRVRRSLPQSFFGRAFLTWFNPGPATGFVLALAGMTTAFLSVCLGLLLFSVVQPVAVPAGTLTAFRGDRSFAVFVFGIFALCYLTIYLGLGLILVRLLRRFMRIDVLGALLVQIVLVLAGCLVPPVIQWSIPGGRVDDYTLLQIPCFVWTLAEVGEWRGFMPGDWGYVAILLIPAAVAVFFLNLPGIIREVRFVRVAKPQRVAEEDATLEPPPPPPQKQSPWD
jgi:hypothetical protein